MQLIKSLGLSAVLLFFTIGDQERIRLTVEPNHSTIGFMVKIAGGVTKVRGKFTDFDLDLDYIDKDLTKSTVKFTIQATSINTGIADRDAHLRSADFFDVEKYPEITFVSSEIRKKGKKYLVEGDFTMHGTTKQVEIPFIVTGEKGNVIGISFEWDLNRKDYGVGSGWKHTSEDNFISDIIRAEIDLWTRKAKNQGN